MRITVLRNRLSIREFCTQHGLIETAFYNWKRATRSHVADCETGFSWRIESAMTDDGVIHSTQSEASIHVEPTELGGRRVHAPFVSVIADRGLTAICRDDLCAAGILRAG